MAKIYPNLPDEFHSSLGEYKIFEALKKLSDDWYVYYSVNWQSRDNNGKIRWGEADFIIFNQFYGILIIEAKSGGICYENGEWIQTRLDNNKKFKMKNPFIQADRSKFVLIDSLSSKIPIGEKCLVEKAVWFPSIKKECIKGINLPLEYHELLVLTEDDLESPEKSIIDIFNYYNSKKYTNLSYNTTEIIKNMILPCFNLVPSISNTNKEIEYRFCQLTNEQSKILDYISDQDFVAIEGAAGTGKTLVAIEHAKRISIQGKVLFLCYNRFLNQHIRNMNSGVREVEYYTIHSFLSKFSHGEDLFDIENCKYVLNEVDFYDLDYSYIVIDETQDIEDGLIEIIYEKCKTQSVGLYVFYDKNQLIYQSKLPSIIKNFDTKLSLKKNCRNTLKINLSINSIFNIPVITNELCIVGNMPKFNYSFSKEKIFSRIESCIDYYLNNGFTLSDIVILSLSSEDRSIIGSNTHINKYQISNVESKESIFFTTSKKYKGLESNVVLVVDFDLNEYEDEIYKRNSYVAFSRARQHLEVFSIITNDNTEHVNNESINELLRVARKNKMLINNLDKNNYQI